MAELSAMFSDCSVIITRQLSTVSGNGGNVGNVRMSRNVQKCSPTQRFFWRCVAWVVGVKSEFRD